MRRKRRSGGAWLPVLPTDIFGNGSQLVSFTDGFATFDPGLPPVGTQPDAFPLAIPLTMDETPRQESGATHTLRDYVEGQDYVLKRVVGKVWMAITEPIDGGNVQRAICCAALAVLPVKDDNANTPDLDPAEYDPLRSENIQQPWLWRRTWILSDNYSNAGTIHYPHSTGDYGSVADGGHVDTKGTARRITKEQRTFIVFAARCLQPVTGGENITGINYGYDLRLFGAMRRGRNRSTFK